jgi:hypothetical protein
MGLYQLLTVSYHTRLRGLCVFPFWRISRYTIRICMPISDACLGQHKELVHEEEQSGLEANVRITVVILNEGNQRTLLQSIVLKL